MNKNFRKTALIVIDVQNDFCTGGTLAVPEGETVVPVINSLMKDFPVIIATADWHPENHISFASSHPGKSPYEVISADYGDQVLWPDHCIAGSDGAGFHPDLNLKPVSLILRKGRSAGLDSYSAFFENDRKTPTGLSGYLKELGIDSLVMCGLATDYCVYFSAADGVNLGFNISLALDAVRGVDVPDGNVEYTLSEMKKAGISIL